MHSWQVDMLLAEPHRVAQVRVNSFALTRAQTKEETPTGAPAGDGRISTTVIARRGQQCIRTKMAGGGGYWILGFSQ